MSPDLLDSRTFTLAVIASGLPGMDQFKPTMPALSQIVSIAKTLLGRRLITPIDRTESNVTQPDITATQRAAMTDETLVVIPTKALGFNRKTAPNNCTDRNPTLHC